MAKIKSPKSSKSTSQNTFSQLIKQTFDFPRLDFSVKKNELYFHGIRLMDLAKKYDTPLRLTYLPKISEQINMVTDLFTGQIKKQKYKGKYHYCYSVKSSHFKFVLDEVFKNKVHIETSSEFELQIAEELFRRKTLSKNSYVIANGFKQPGYLQRIAELNASDKGNLVCVLDNKEELDQLARISKAPMQLGIRLAIAEHPTSDIYMSRHGFKTTEVVDFYKNRISGNKKFALKMIHFWIENGISDTAYYWSELERHVHTYCDLRQECDTLDSINIGGGLKIHEALDEEIPYDYLIEEIVSSIKAICSERNTPEPHIFTEFGTHPVGESSAILYSVIGQKQQNDFERWYMIDSSFITTLPEIWGIKQKFILLPLNHWNRPYSRIHLGGLTNDGMDYYNAEKSDNQIFLPEVEPDEELIIGFFHTGAYQESLGGYGGIQHCLVPAPRHVVIDERNGKITYELFAEEQDAESMMKILGY